MSLGGQTITLRSVVLGAPGRMGIRAKSSVSTEVSGVLFRPWESKEPTGGNTDVITQVFKATLPPVAVALAADETYELDYQGESYVITEVKKHPDLSGRIHHVSILCRKWVA